MSEKKKEKKKSPYPVDGKVKIRQSHYTFAREYPSRTLPMKTKKRKNRRRQRLYALGYFMLFALIVCLSFFLTELMMNISYTEKEKLTTSAEITQEPQQTEKESLRALYMPLSGLRDEEYIKDFAALVKRKNCNSVVIDFKTAEGKLAYSSLNEYAIKAGCSLFDNNTVRQALDIFEQKDIRVFARLYCFGDPLVSESSRELAVKYMDTAVNWLDGSDENGGVSRLNPFSKKARGYILSIIKELTAFELDGYILEDIAFPSGKSSDSATCPGEKAGDDRNALLRDFISQAEKLIPSSSSLLISQSPQDVSEGNEALYAGSLIKSSADGFCVDTLLRDEKYVIDKKTDYSSILSLFSQIEDKAGKKEAVFIIDATEYSRSYIRKLIASGHDSFIIFSQNADY